MATAIADVNKFYTIEPKTQFYSVNLDNINNEKDAKEVIGQLSHDARIEALKSIAHYIIASATTILVTAAAVIAFKLSTIAIGIFTFPLAIIPPVYYLVTSLGGVAVGALVGYYVYKQFAAKFIDQGKLHWNHSQHLFNQKAAVLAKVATLKQA